ncbi:hypothetical protein G1H11_21135 [Phytoactinopolyspora alkaliphila]|uniref:Uncharacterized protein n=1 Tax=Phytoactinopolyspora alkaliphila TaxID=1783498 RepID=A0A6N9YS93_9ACTN|nr:hypothetical protein [Phytoactinopolyspora alkaliphila]NED97807.1 hypothetical protein [Phytoactinopolyspora alkaliphila]
MAITIQRLELRVRPGHLPWDSSRRYDTVDFLLDGRDLQEWLKRWTPPEHRGVDGYLGHPVGTDVDELLAGRWSGDAEGFGGRTALLGCQCTEIGCGPLVCTIQIDRSAVTWSEFSRFRGPTFDYEPVEFEFERHMYDQAIEQFMTSRR